MQAINPPLLPIEGNKAHNYLMVIGLNPSTADETKDDPTIRRCIDFAKRWGYGALCMTNLFAWRDTKPENMRLAADPVGVMNDSHLALTSDGAGIVLAAWGKHGAFKKRDDRVLRIMRELHRPVYCLRRNQDGSPQHPLYVPAETKPILFF